jgi:bla regulator protein BlaR1
LTASGIIFFATLKTEGRLFMKGAEPMVRWMLVMGLIGVLVVCGCGKDIRRVDRIDYPFVDDPQVVGRWTSIDFVKTVNDFSFDERKWQKSLFLAGMSIHKNGTTSGPWTWTKGMIIHPGDQTASRYFIKEMEGLTYMFFEWKSGDYTFRNMEPWFYVLVKT